MISSDDIAKCESIKQRFFPEAVNSSAIPAINEDSLKRLEILFSTGSFQAPMLKDISLLVENGAKVFAFEFAYKGSMTMTDVFRLSSFQLYMNFLSRYVGGNLYQKNSGVCHADDLLYLFPFKLMPNALKTSDDKLTSHRFLSFISNFATYGTPGKIDNIEWHSTSTDNFRELRIDEELSFSTIESTKQEQLQFWIDEIYSNKKEWSWSQDPNPQIHSVSKKKMNGIKISASVH